MTVLFNLKAVDEGYATDGEHGWTTLDALFAYYFRQGKIPSEIMKILSKYVEDGCKVKVSGKLDDQLIWKLPLDILEGIWPLVCGESFLPKDTRWYNIKCVYKYVDATYIHRVFNTDAKHWELITRRVGDKPNPSVHVFRRVERSKLRGDAFGDKWLRVETVPECNKCSTQVFDIYASDMRINCLSCGNVWDV